LGEEKTHLMKITSIIVMLALAAIASFPPTDFVAPATDGRRIGDMTFPGTPERRINRGFEFISEVGGPVQIRYPQWFTQIGMGLVVGGIALFIFRRKS